MKLRNKEKCFKLKLISQRKDIQALSDMKNILEGRRHGLDMHGSDSVLRRREI